jgi:hypothetical protein
MSTVKGGFNRSVTVYVIEQNTFKLWGHSRDCTFQGDAPSREIELEDNKSYAIIHSHFDRDKLVVELSRSAIPFLSKEGSYDRARRAAGALHVVFKMLETIRLRHFSTHEYVWFMKVMEGVRDDMPDTNISISPGDLQC